MKEIRIFARAGQGAITSATILASAAFEEGKYAFAFPHFGSERMGAPLNAYVRLDDKPIRSRSQVKEPDYVLVQDPTLLAGYNVAEGLKPGGVVVINSTETPEALGLGLNRGRVVTVPASQIAQELLGRADRSNTPLIGAFAAATGEISLDTLKDAVRRRFPGSAGEKNAQAVEQGYGIAKAKEAV
ncbi:MAG: 2-oxoacid:acceptor oxidoreductase family protein [Dehalococcoidia bacterium]|jgi:pyruvate ferredoxin oxidoreductase gamma subunit|nr:2-oxoacid:acceptor oxidoreductase family protein [Dehalococcoidia bacterium]MDP7470039.1 2-oxoacid:acceptor oxidoreductase family protein [Dehalococcoidia bacterium]